MRESYAYKIMQIDSYFYNNPGAIPTILQKIPDEPRIPIKNFLLDLICEMDGKMKSIYMKNASDIIKEIWHEIINNNWRELNVRKLIPNKLNITGSLFYAYKNGRKNISVRTMFNLIKLWQKLCNKKDKEVIDKWNEIFDMKLLLSTHSKCQKTSLPRHINPKLSYLLGWICGDGNLQEGGNHYTLKISEKSKKQLEIILKPLFIELFEVDPPIFIRNGNSYAIQIGSKIIFRFFKNVMEIRVGQIPPIINDFDLTNKKYFLIGLFDAEGYVNPKYSDSVIIISQSNKKFLEKVIYLFNEIKINFIGPHKHKTDLGIWYTIEIRRKIEILKYVQNMGSFHVEKSKKLQQLVNKIEKKWHS